MPHRLWQTSLGKFQFKSFQREFPSQPECSLRDVQSSLGTFQTSGRSAGPLANMKAKFQADRILDM
jgi:hypothetical protein